MRSLLVTSAMVVCASSAWAEDVNDNGCDDAYEAGGTCVSVSATVGLGISFGDFVTIGPRATLAGHNTHALNPLPVGDNVVVGRQSSLGVDHVLGDDTTIGRSVVAGVNLTTLSSASIGYGSTLGDDVTLGNAATIGTLVDVGDFATIGALAVIGRSTVIDDSMDPLTGTVIDGVVGPNSIIGSNVRVEQGARVRKDSHIHSGARIESTARVGRSSVVEAGATVHGLVRANGKVGAGATVSAGASVLRGGELCAGETLLPNEVVPANGTWPLTGCVSGGPTDPVAFDLHHVYIPTSTWVAPRGLGTLAYSGTEDLCSNVGLVSNAATGEPLGLWTAPCASPTGPSCGAVDGDLFGTGCLYLYSCPPTAPNAALTGAQIKVDVTDYDPAWETTWCQAATSDLGIAALGVTSYYSDVEPATMLNP